MAEPASVELRYQRGDASADAIKTAVDEVLAELTDPSSEPARAARAAGMEPDQLANANVVVREGAQGAEPILTSIIIGITVSAGAKVAETFWNDVIWPRLRRHLGARALGDRKPDDAQAAS